MAFSFLTKKFTPLEKQLPCYLIYTSPLTLKIIRGNISKSAIYNGVIKGIGPRYCPAIESKVVRFADKPRHQLFLEPEYEFGDSIYLQGFSTGMPHEIQDEMVHSLPGLEKAEILKYSYEIEYDAVKPLQFDSTLRVKAYEGLYGAGQICGTSGYEEAAGLGLMAGINASLWIKGEKPFILRRDESYIGVMIDDLVSKGTDEPYRLMSSRAEYRLLLRHDNADLRLTSHGHDIGLISDERYADFLNKYKRIDEAIEILKDNNVSKKKECSEYLLSKGYTDTNVGHKGYELLKRPGLDYPSIQKLMPELDPYSFDEASSLALETKVKYEGYIKKELADAKNMAKLEDIALPEKVDYSKVDGLALEARQKLNAVMPRSIGQASRIPGVNPADVSILILSLRKKNLL